MTLELKSVRKRLGTFELPALDLKVAEGEYFVLLGPSGVGKTVLLEIIAGLMHTDSGRIYWKGEDVTTTSPERRRFGIVYQDYGLFPHLSVLQNIIYGLRAHGIARAAALEQARAVAELVNITPLFSRSPATLSGGEQQRTALARALVVSPELLLLDEPLSAVDLQMRRQLRIELKQLHRQTRTTFLHVTHDIDEAMQLGERIGVMLDGRIRQVGTPEELFQHPSDPLVADFLGIRNILAVSQHKDGACDVNGVRIYVDAHGKPFEHIWIRPEEVLLSRAPFESSARNQLVCTVEDWELRDMLVLVRISSNGLSLSAMVTYISFEDLHIEKGSKLYATFKTSAIHCF